MVSRIRQLEAEMIPSELTAGPLPQLAEAGLDLEQAFERHAQSVNRFLRRMGLGAQEAEDVMSETFLVAYEKRDTFDTARPVRPWLFGIAVRLAKQHRRRSWFKRLLFSRLEINAQEEAIVEGPER